MGPETTYSRAQLPSVNAYWTTMLIKGVAFFKRIITGDETCVHHFELKSKCQSMEWKCWELPVKKKFKIQPSAGKVMLTIFWDSQGPVLEQYLEKGSTATVHVIQWDAERQTEACKTDQMPRPVFERFFLLHDNSRPHTAVHTVQTFQELGFKVFEQSAYSSELTPLDYHLFGPLR